MRSEELHDRRLQARLTQRELSELSGVPQTTISKIENGHVQGSDLTLTRLGNALGEHPCQELLDALKYALEYIEADRDFDEEPLEPGASMQDSVIEEARAAIQRAER